MSHAKRYSSPGAHDANLPPQPIEGPTCFGCTNLRYRRIVVRGTETVTDESTTWQFAGGFECFRHGRICTVKQTPRPLEEGCYTPKG